jgi:hypothetical protein
LGWFRAVRIEELHVTCRLVVANVQTATLGLRGGGGDRKRVAGICVCVLAHRNALAVRAEFGDAEIETAFCVRLACRSVVAVDMDVGNGERADLPAERPCGWSYRGRSSYGR